MKQLKFLFLFLLLTVSFSSYSQTADMKSNLSFGGGSEGYKGDLGSVWFKMDEEWYGFVGIFYNHYLNRSFDLITSLTFGDYGHCREKDERIYREDGSEVLNMLGRLTSLVVSGKYKLANGYLLKEKARVNPYIYLGAGINNISEGWWKNHTRATTGYFGSLNYGIGAQYNFCERYNFSYNLGFGYFTSDKVDKRSEGGNDMVMQHAVMLGYSF